MYKCEIDVNNQKQIFVFNKVAKQANGSCLLQVGNSVLLAAVTIDNDNEVKEDFLPLTVQYIEKSYAAGKIPSGFVKRESKPSDFETLTSRIVDRSLRPLFPNGYKFPTQITIMVLSVDEEADLQQLALNVASAALYVSDIPINHPVNGVRIAKIDNEIVVNPSFNKLSESSLDMFVSGVDKELLMIEMRALSGESSQIIPSGVDIIAEPMFVSDIETIHQTNELCEDEMIELLTLASEKIDECSQMFRKYFEPCMKQPLDLVYSISLVNDVIYDYVKKNWREQLLKAINEMTKSERNGGIIKIAKAICEELVEFEYEMVLKAVENLKKELVRGMIVNDRIRADGRGLTTVRPISIETNILPKTHGSCLFTRGETQALVVCTLGGGSDSQMFELLTDKKAQNERFMVHYNFPGFSVGESEKVGPPGRRELGHGNLAKRAIEPTIYKDFDGTIRLVSEILESNGSSSMATVCGGSLALRATGIETSKLVAGVAMGLIVEGDKYAILTDIMGLEDHDGDMDFKVAGTSDGITAMQMDIKLGGVSLEILKEALYQAKDGRNHILNIMETAAKEIVVNSAVVPSTSIFSIDPSKIVHIIGQAGKTIKEIIEKFEVSIDLDRDKGKVKVSGKKSDGVKGASEHIKNIVSSVEPETNPMTLYKEGEVYKGVVKKVVDFGVFVELPKGYEGLMHISKASDKRVEKMGDIFKEGDEVNVRILSVNRKKVELGNANYY
ncbi:MAG: polyribonucleotide nucleotidyltransferase [Campylobacterales bacterium]|nr:polyribonucleotide nucleotidyltransferase [Campylobacterales bacterium]